MRMAAVWVPSNLETKLAEFSYAYPHRPMGWISDVMERIKSGGNHPLFDVDRHASASGFRVCAACYARHARSDISIEIVLGDVANYVVIIQDF
jgi:hypothetical protein